MIRSSGLLYGLPNKVVYQQLIICYCKANGNEIKAENISEEVKGRETNKK